MKALALAAKGAWQARQLLKRLKPRGVLATGGFVGVPVLLAARSLGIPYALAEQNVVPGKVNRWFAKGARFVAISFEESRDHFPPGTNAQLWGNPLRAQVLKANGAAWRLAKGIPAEALLLVASGGSQGAASLNSGLALALPHLLESFPTLRVAWATGQGEAKARQAEAQAHAGRVLVAPFFEDLPEAMAAAQLVLGRAGATSLAELTALGKPGVLVPYPHAGAHQAANAKAAVAAGAMRVVDDAEAKIGGLTPILEALLGDAPTLAQMASAARGLGRPEAARTVAQALLAW